MNPFAAIFGEGQAAETMAEFVPYALGIPVVIVVLIVFKIVWKMWVARSIRKQPPTASGMILTDLDKLRVEGQIDEAEYKRIRRKMVERELAHTRNETQADFDKRIMTQVAYDPDAARQWIDPSQATAKTAGGGGAQGSRGDLTNLTEPRDPQPADPAPPESTDRAREQIPPKPTPPEQEVPNNKFRHLEPIDRPHPKPAAPQTNQKSSEQKPKTRKPMDIDVLLQKGLITPEEYERFRKNLE